MIFLNMKFIKFHGIPWNSMELQKSSMEFHGTFLGKIKSSMEFYGTREYGKSSMEFHGTLDLDKIQNLFSMVIETYFDQKVPWNFLQSSMELFEQHLNNTCGSMEFHGIPWNHMCCSNVVQKVPWNSGESSMELFDQNKFQWPLKRDFEWYFGT